MTKQDVAMLIVIAINLYFMRGLYKSIQRRSRSAKIGKELDAIFNRALLAAAANDFDTFRFHRERFLELEEAWRAEFKPTPNKKEDHVPLD